jgi:seryl-tRNA synthetase
MLDIKFIRKNPDVVRADLVKRGDNEKQQWLEDLIAKDVEYRQLLSDMEKMRAERNVITRRISEAVKKKDDKAVTEAKKAAAELPAKIKAAEARVEEIQAKVKFYLMRLPNVLHDSVPVGKDDTENQVVRKWGVEKTAKEFGFEPKSHVDMLTALDVADLERAANVSGARAYYLKNDLVLLDMSIHRMALDMMIKKGFTPVLPPFMMRREPYEGVTDLADFENVMYKIENDDLYLIATSEHPIAAMHMNEILEEEKLPLKYAGISTCFRKEAGAQARTPRASSGSTSSTRWSSSCSASRKTPGSSTRSCSPTPKRCSRRWRSPTASSTSALETSASSRPRSTTWRHGCRSRRPTGK